MDEMKEIVRKPDRRVMVGCMSTSTLDGIIFAPTDSAWNFLQKIVWQSGFLPEGYI
jgi:hypothetical protein